MGKHPPLAIFEHRSFSLRIGDKQLSPQVAPF
jgi:hypothetical protein